MAGPLITREMLPAILGRYPSCRPIFDRYGLTAAAEISGRKNRFGSLSGRIEWMNKR
jgi:hypothetical protein